MKHVINLEVKIITKPSLAEVIVFVTYHERVFVILKHN